MQKSAKNKKLLRTKCNSIGAIFPGLSLIMNFSLFLPKVFICDEIKRPVKNFLDLKFYIYSVKVYIGTCSSCQRTRVRDCP